jgi:hypothetical protein
VQDKGNADYALRKHKGVRLTTVPTFGRWDKGRLEMRLEEVAFVLRFHFGF